MKDLELKLQISVLKNEAEVEALFVEKILEWLGWEDKNILRKHSLNEFNCRTGSGKLNYKPDYMIKNNDEPILVIDAKSPEVNLDNFTNQCASYCLHLNQQKETVNYFILSNGCQTDIYPWKGGKKYMSLSFDDFKTNSDVAKEFYKLFSKEGFTKKIPTKNKTNNTVPFKKINKEEAQKIFKSCHKYIWNAEKMGVNASFIEFIKLIFLKMRSDKEIHKKYGNAGNNNSIHVAQKDMLFSSYWISKHESDMQKNPIKEIQFTDMMNKLRDEIRRKKKKPLFEDDETINMKATTIEGVVKKLEFVDLYGIDEDLNGRLFETFLNATMRGNDLGQYFTPRSIVKLGCAIADLKADKDRIDKVLDGSCGTGGFLIEAFTRMKEKINNNDAYSNSDKEKLIEKLCTSSIYGIDAAKDPKLAKIARINMYLHGDGGSQIYLADGLIKDMKADETDSPEIRAEMEDMSLNIKPEFFDVILTNPPFSMSLSLKNEEEKRVLEKYDLLTYNNNNKQRKSLRTGVMFLERYEGLLKKGGKLITILDNTILNSPKMKYVRDYIREKFIIKAIISLHGNAFQQSKARVKTSLLYLQKKTDANEQQPNAFMTFSVKLGVDDMPITTPQSIIDKAREEANKEIKKILENYSNFQSGKKSKWSILPDKLMDRLDVKHCISFKGRYKKQWEKNEYEIKKLSDIFDAVNEAEKPDSEENYKILTIKYDGQCNIDEERLGGDIKEKGYIVETGNIVISKYNAYYGAIGYISEDFNNTFASKSYIVLKPKDEIDGIYAWSVLRTTEIRADILDSAIGMGRSPISWKGIKDIEIPFINTEERKKIVNNIKESWKKIKKAKDDLKTLQQDIGNQFNLESDDSIYRFNANKPPK